MPDERQVAQEILTRVSHAWRTVDQIDQSRLARDQREIFSIIQDFLTKAREALSTKDLPRAQILADKASKLAEDLAASVRRTP